MNWIDSVMPWSVPKQNKISDYIRIFLGVIIVTKGVSFALNLQEWLEYFTGFLSSVSYNTGPTFISNLAVLQDSSNILHTTLVIFLATYVIMAHLIGGILLGLGLFTRWICLIQIPILIGAVFLVNLEAGFGSTANIMEFATSVIVLLALVYFFVIGSGVNSIDDFRRREVKGSDYLTQTRIR